MYPSDDSEVWLSLWIFEVTSVQDFLVFKRDCSCSIDHGENDPVSYTLPTVLQSWRFSNSDEVPSVPLILFDF